MAAARADARVGASATSAALISLGVLALIALICIIGPWVLPHALDADWDAMSAPPNFKMATPWGNG